MTAHFFLPKNLWITPALFFLTAEAVAAPLPVMIAPADCEPSLLHRADFLNPVVGLTQLGRPLSLQSSVIQFSNIPVKDEDEREANLCTGTFVSDVGDILTASHCIDSCLYRADGTPKEPRPEKCLAYFAGQPQFFTVLKHSPCRAELAHEALTAKRRGRSVAKYPAACLQEPISDLAVIRLSLPDAFPYTCLPVGEKPPAPGESLIAMAYPEQTERWKHQRRDALDSDGERLQFSSGKIADGKTCSSRWEPNNSLGQWWYGEGPHETKYPLDQEFQKSFAGMIPTTVDIARGSSGAGLINSENEIVGVASAQDTSVQSARWQCEGASFFQPLQDWREGISIPAAAIYKDPVICDEKRNPLSDK